MRYAAFKGTIRKKLERTPQGMTWKELRERLKLPYERPCPAWVKALEQEIGLRRVKTADSGRALVWRTGAKENR